MTIYDNYDFLIKIKADTVLWRYMNFEKYKSMLKESALFFCRNDKFNDEYEGSLPKLVVENRNKRYPFNQDNFKYMHKKLRETTLMNCWHININENSFFWKLYSENNYGIAVKTDYQSLKNSIIDDGIKILPTKIRYIDFQKDEYFHVVEYPYYKYNMLLPFIHKKIEFINEQEFRLIYSLEDEMQGDFLQKNECKGIFIRTNLSMLINQVIVNTNDDSFFNKISEITKSFKYDFPIEKSKLNYEPLY
ncbi:MAG TPA: hypothetical protein PKN48_11140 [Bacteroidales bacterium]|nr:hypothetical protein [Bacteroidales bacterium]